MPSYEIEIKSLLGGEENAEKLKAEMADKDPNFKILGSHSQLNHYFEGGDINMLSEKLKPFLTEEQAQELSELADEAESYSVRTRSADGKVIFVLKVSIDDTTSSNGTARREFEVVVSNLSLEQLDQLILDCNFSYQAKWSRQRQEFSYKGSYVTIDKNAGYGYLAEFETQVDDQSKAQQGKDNLRALIKELNIEELSQERLARMFDYYNQHWQEYYGTDKIFNIE